MMKLNKQLSETVQEFMPESFCYDIEHKLAEKTAEYALLAIQLRSYKEKSTEWCLQSESEKIIVKSKPNDPLTFNYSFSNNKITFEQTKQIIAADELMSAQGICNGK